VIILPAGYDTAAPYDLLREAEMGRVGFDQRLLRSLVARPAETLAGVVRFGGEYHEDRLVNLDEQLLDLCRYFRAPEVLPYYFELLRRSEDSVPDPLVEAFAEMGAPAVDSLVERYEKGGADERADLPFLMAALGTRDPRILSILLRTLETDAYEGALCLDLYGDPAAIPAVEAALAKGPSPEDAKALQDCLAGLKGPPAHRELEPFHLFDLYAETASPLFGAITREECLEFLECPVAGYREEAALSFCDEHYPPDVRARLLDHASHDPEPRVRGASLRALAEASGDQGVRDLMIRVLEDEGRPEVERAGALLGLAEKKAPASVHSRFLEFYEKPEWRSTALQAMWRSLDERYGKYFLDNLGAADLETQCQAIQGAGALGMHEAASRLAELFRDEDVREEALFSYALAAPGKTTRKSVEALLSRIEELAGGLSAEESEAVTMALDHRLERDGLQPIFHVHDEESEEEEAAPPPAAAAANKPGRNDPCPCGSGKKYKKCCGA
jgi:hypothetical protein